MNTTPEKCPDCGHPPLECVVPGQGCIMDVPPDEFGDGLCMCKHPCHAEPEAKNG